MASKSSSTNEAPEAREEAAEAPVLDTVAAAIKKMVAKGNEAGLEMMIGGLCESALTMRALIAWRDALMEGKMLLRDVVDLDATYGGSPDEAAVAGVAAEGGEPAAEAAPAAEGEERPAGAPEAAEGEGEGEGEEGSISLAAMEEELKPGVLENLDEIAALYKKLNKLQEQRLDVLKEGDEIAKPTEKRYDKLRAEMVQAMNNVRLNNARIEYLVEQLYSLNRRLQAADGKLLRLAEHSGVKRP